MIKTTPIKILILFLSYSSQVALGQYGPKKTGDFKSWNLEQLLFTIDSGLLDEQERNEYIEQYLQKAKGQRSHEDILTGYKKKIANLKDPNLKYMYADSLLHYASGTKDNRALAVAYDYKAYVSYTAKHFEKALNYSFKAEQYALKVGDGDVVHEIYSTIGNSYYHLENYQQAFHYFRISTKYHQRRAATDYNNRLSLVGNLYSLSKTAFRLEKMDTLQILLEEAKHDLEYLKEHHRPLENAYFDLIGGMSCSYRKAIRCSDSLLQAALPPIVENDDFANEHLAYLYLGKNRWNAGERELGLDYFLKIDSLYQGRKFMNKELSEAYSYIIEYYKSEKDPSKQLYYTDMMLTVSNDLQQSNKNLSKYMFANLDTRNLEESKKALERQLRINKNWMSLTALLLAVLLLGFGVFYLYNLRSRRKLLMQFASDVAGGSINEPSDMTTVEKEDLQDIEKARAFDRTTHLLKKLAKFEENKEFLKKVTLDELAQQFATNRTTLSKVINENKGSFSSYLNNLRVIYAVAAISSPDSNLHLHTVEALAEEFGFGNPKSFSVAFKEITGMSVADYIKFKKNSA